MLKDEVRAVLARVSSWPEERQRLLAELAVEIEAEMTRTSYHASCAELEAVDAALRARTASEAEVEAAYAAFRRG
ncbi:MAG: hypothetical protein ACM3JG_19420 [Thiohalocapsa sp.]